MKSCLVEWVGGSDRSCRKCSVAKMLQWHVLKSSRYLDYINAYIFADHIIRLSELYKQSFS